MKKTKIRERIEEVITNNLGYNKHRQEEIKYLITYKPEFSVYIMPEIVLEEHLQIHLGELEKITQENTEELQKELTKKRKEARHKTQQLEQEQIRKYFKDNNKELPTMYRIKTEKLNESNKTHYDIAKKILYITQLTQITQPYKTNQA